MVNEFMEIRLLPDGPEKEALLRKIAAAQRADRVRLGLPPMRPIDRNRYLCGCPHDPHIGPSRVDNDSCCIVCSGGGE